MYKITWDKETGGVQLNTKVVENTISVSPRPVFFEELDLLCLKDFGWEYPQCDEPLLWACNKQYYYRGDFVFEAKGANIYDAATVVLQPGFDNLKLKPIDTKKMLERNHDAMFLIESEAIEFIRDIYTTYSDVNRANAAAKANSEIDYEALAERAEKKTKQKMAVVKQGCESFDIVPLKVANAEGKKALLSTRIDHFIASFSGGKDSQVVLDLVTRAIPPTAFEVIYSDTGYELPPSIDLYEKVKEYYGEKFPTLKFSTTKNHESVLHYWDEIGTPSDTHRWCCSVMKTAPLYRSLKVEGNKQAKVLAFEGVRAEESNRRSGYNRIGKGVKHTFVVNARPVFDWNSTEIFLYLFLHSLPINPAYRLGKPRVGCIFCPFGSPWDDMIVNRFYNKELKPFLSVIEKIVADRKIPNAKEYIKERKWKLRASGTNVDNKTLVKIKSDPNAFIAEIAHGNKSILDWLPAIGNMTFSKKGSKCTGGIEFGKTTYSFSIIQHDNKITFKVDDNNNIRLRYLLRRATYKSAYCINCEACEIECPTGALSVYPNISINKIKCIHCFKCIDFHQHGCIAADSLVTTMGNITNKSKISPYGTFGIQDAWVDDFFCNPESFWEDNSLGKKQIPSFKTWLKDAEIIDNSGKLTKLGNTLANVREFSPSLLWEIIYINLCYNNPLMEWFITDIKTPTSISRKELEALILEYFNGAFSTSSITYALQALLQVFKYSPIGTEFEILTTEDSKNSPYYRKPYEEISLEALAYSIYKYASFAESDMIRVSDFYKQETNKGVYREFGISKNELIKKLRSLSNDPNRVLIAELNMGLDHITLRNDLTAYSVLELLAK